MLKTRKLFNFDAPIHSGVKQSYIAFSIQRAARKYLNYSTKKDNVNKTLQSIGAVLAGFITVVILSVATDTILESLGIFPEQGLFITWMLVVALLYRCLYTVIGGYITARLAPRNPLRHSIILGCIGTVAAIMGTIVGWNLSQHWYPIALVVTAIPCTLLGGKLYENLQRH